MKNTSIHIIFFFFLCVLSSFSVIAYTASSDNYVSNFQLTGVGGVANNTNFTASLEQVFVLGTSNTTNASNTFELIMGAIYEPCSWSCGSWGTCSNGFQERECTINSPLCYPATTIPDTERSCTANTGPGGGGGLSSATGGTSTQGSIKRSHSHAWDVLPSGSFVHNVRDVQIPVAQIRLLVSQDTNNAFLSVRTFHGMPGAVLELSGVYEYFEINHHGLTGSDYEMDFRVPQGSEEVRFWRFEESSWVEYGYEFNQTVDDFDIYTVRLPGFSYFAITLGEEFVDSEPVVIEQAPEPVQEEQTPDDQVVVVGEGEEPLEELDRSWAWLLYTFLFVIILGGLGVGTFYAYSIGLFDKKKTKKKAGLIFNESDPFYKLQVFINSELDKGVSSDAIREELVSAGWDDLIVDEELEKVMSLRV